MDIKQHFAEGLGHASYILIAGNSHEAALVDPRRDIGVYVEEIDRAGLRPRYILETHTHNDYISGAKPLAERYGAEYVASAESGLAFPYHPVREGDSISFGEVRLELLSTPGHTPEHVSYVVVDTSRAEEPVAVLSGGDLLVGGVGRVDLLGPELAQQLAPRLHDSLHWKFLALEDYVEVLPTHGAGSLCGKGTGGKRTTTIGYERRFNRMLNLDRDDFVREALSGNPGMPTYYRRMRPANQAGPTAWEPPRPRSLSREEWDSLTAAGAIVVDTRPAMAFGGGHPRAAVNVALGASFATWVGWLLPSEVPLVLILEDTKDWHAAVTALARVGYDQVAGFVQPGSAVWDELAPLIARTEGWMVHELRRQLAADSVQLVDVRADSEWNAGHIEGALHIRLEDLVDSRGALDPDRPVATICGSGARSSTAASLLLREGSGRVANVVGGMTAWVRAGFPVVHEPNLDASRILRRAA